MESGTKSGKINVRVYRAKKGEKMNTRDLDKIHYVKNELENYWYIMRGAAGMLIQVQHKEEQLKEYAASNKLDPNWEYPLQREITQLNRRIDSKLLRTSRVNIFLNKLGPNDRQIFYDLHMTPEKNKRKKYEDYCYDLGMSKSTLQRYVNKKILDNWGK